MAIAAESLYLCLVAEERIGWVVKYLGQCLQTRESEVNLTVDHMPSMLKIRTNQQNRLYLL